MAIPHDLLGTHISIAGGVELAPRRARTLGCSAMQIFTKSNRQWSDKPIPDDRARAFRAAMTECEIDAVIAHATYLINLGAPDPVIAEKSVVAIADELERCELLGVPGIVLHPGAHLGTGEKRGIQAIAKRLREALKRTQGCKSAVFLEIVAGQGTTLGRTLEELAAIRDAAKDTERVAVCIDTCHAHAGGYDLGSGEGWDALVTRFDELLGLDALRAIHLNDSKHPFDSRRDRHEHIGRGHLGLAAFHALVNDPRVAHVPKALETAKRDDGHEDLQNLRVLRAMVGKAAPPKRKPAWKVPEKVDEARAKRLKRGE